MSNETTYLDILSRFEGPSDFARRVGAELEAAKQIFKRQSIPAHYGKSIRDAGVATADELVAAAANSKRERQTQTAA